MYCYTVRNLKVFCGLDLSQDAENTPCLWIGDKPVCMDEEMLRVQAARPASLYNSNIHAAQLQRKHFDSYWLCPSKGEEWLEGWQARESPVLVHYQYESKGVPLRLSVNGGAQKFDHLVHVDESGAQVLCRMAIGDSIDVYNKDSGKILARLSYDGQNFHESHNPSQVFVFWTD